jgi:endonuclease G
MKPTLTLKAIAALFTLSTLAACSSTGMNAGNDTSGANAGATSAVGSSGGASGGACAAQFADGTQPQLTNAKLAAKTRALCFSEYAVLHSGVTRTPLWASEHLTYNELLMDIDRKDNFHAEQSLPEDERAELADYAGSGYDRGHLAPAADMPSVEAMSESFSLANMTPQNPTNNRGLWSSIEAKTRNLAKERGELFVVSGAIFAGSSIKRLNNRVFVPTSYFKAIYDANTGESGAYWVANDANKNYKMLSINELVQTAGIDPFPSISESSKNTVMVLPQP